MPLTILVADDDPHIREVLDFALRKNGHATLMARDGKEALALFRRHAPDLVVLDVGMPEMDGLDVCRVVRQTSNVPIIFLSARDEEIDRVLGLEIGGDDYMVKPFSPRELVARIGVIMRRAATVAEETAPTGLVQGDLRIDQRACSASLATRPLALTGTEFAILRAMAEQPGYLFDRERLMAAAYGGRVRVSGRTIDSHIRNIRAKCAAAGSSSVVETLHGIGFRLGPCVADMQAEPPGSAGERP